MLCCDWFIFMQIKCNAIDKEIMECISCIMIDYQKSIIHRMHIRPLVVKRYSNIGSVSAVRILVQTYRMFCMLNIISDAWILAHAFGRLPNASNPKLCMWLYIIATCRACCPQPTIFRERRYFICCVRWCQCVAARCSVRVIRILASRLRARLWMQQVHYRDEMLRGNRSDIMGRGIRSVLCGDCWCTL